MFEGFRMSLFVLGALISFQRLAKELSVMVGHECLHGLGGCAYACVCVSY